jgi:membrane protease subunit HflK
MTRSARTIIFIAAVIVAISIVLTSVYTVGTAETALVLHFGEYVRQADPGLHVKVPLGIEMCRRSPVKRIFTEHFGTMAREPSCGGDQRSEPGCHYSMVKGDLNIIEVSCSIQYGIVDSVAWAFRAADQQKTIRDTREAVISTLIGDRALADVTSRERDHIERAA